MQCILRCDLKILPKFDGLISYSYQYLRFVRVIFMANKIKYEFLRCDQRLVDFFEVLYMYLFIQLRWLLCDFVDANMDDVQRIKRFSGYFSFKHNFRLARAFRTHLNSRLLACCSDAEGIIPLLIGLGGLWSFPAKNRPITSSFRIEVVKPPDG